MKKLILFIVLMLSLGSIAFATAPTDSNFPVGVNNASAVWSTSITDNAATHQRCRAVYVGTSQSLDFSFDGSTWVTFQGATAGTVMPIQVVGARITSGSASPNSGDVVFLY